MHAFASRSARREHARAETGDLARRMDEARVTERALGITERRIATAQLDDVVLLDARGAVRFGLIDEAHAASRRRTSGSRAPGRAVDEVIHAILGQRAFHTNDQFSSPRMPRRSGYS